MANYDVIGNIVIVKFGREEKKKTKKFWAEKFLKEHKQVKTVLEKESKFSGRLRTQKTKEIALMVKKNESVLVLFGGVAPFAIIVAKNSGAKKVVSVELGRECSKYAKENTRRNKLENIVEIIQGDVKKVLPKMKEKFDRIIMARPQLKDTFLAPTLKKIKKNGIIHYYGFYPLEEKQEMLEEIRVECAKEKKKIKILKTKKAGEIGYKRFSWRVDFKVLN